MIRSLFVLVAALFASSPLHAAEPAKVFVVLWFDTEDYILPASDDAALRVADFLTEKDSGRRSRSSGRRRAPWRSASAPM